MHNKLESKESDVKKKPFVLFIAVLLLVCLAACAYPMATSTGSQVSATNAPAAPYNTPHIQEALVSSSLSVHFIDVGQADAALVLCGEEAMLIDGGNAADSDLVYTYLETHSIDHLEYIICTHPHEDHVGGLAGALNYATVDHALSPAVSYDTKAFSNFKKYLDAQGVPITVPSPGSSFMLGDAYIEILGPISDAEDPNNLSIVLRIVFGNVSFLFTGDAEREEEMDLLNVSVKCIRETDTAPTVGSVGADFNMGGSRCSL